MVQKEIVASLNDFTTELAEAIESLRREDVEHRPVHGFYRKFGLKRFPYTIYYFRGEKERVVEISAVFHNHKDESSFTARLG